MASEHFAFNCGTQLIEDCFAAAKNAKQVRGSKLFRTPERSMAVMVSPEIPWKKHRYEQPGLDIPTERKTARLNHKAFGKAPIAPTIGGSDVAPTSSKAGWHSPKAENWGGCRSRTMCCWRT